MFLITSIASGILIAAAMVQLGLAWWYRIHFPKRPLATFDHQSRPSTPRVAIIVAVRGCDPSLEQCLIGLMGQDYPNFEVHLVVDSQGDQEWEPIRRLQHAYRDSKIDKQMDKQLHVHLLASISDRCSLKCNAILQGLAQVSDQAEYLLLLDADVTPHKNWINELIGPLAQNPHLGLVCGTQWFEPPEQATWGSLLRSTWNGGAIVPTVVFNNPWAGSLAMRMEDVHRAKIAETWAKSIVDDGPLRQSMAALGLECHFAAPLIMVNKENCSFRYACQWMTRMLLWSRLHESNYWLSVVHSLFSTTTMTLLFGLLLASIWSQQWITAGIAAAALILCGVLSVAAYLVVRQTVQISREYQGRTMPKISGLRLFQLFWAVPLTQWVYLYACFRALVAKKIVWRGVTYRVDAQDQIQIIENRSLQRKEADNGMSI